jgi:hypothetical protein
MLISLIRFFSHTCSLENIPAGMTFGSEASVSICLPQPDPDLYRLSPFSLDLSKIWSRYQLPQIIIPEIVAERLVIGHSRELLRSVASSQSNP